MTINNQEQPPFVQETPGVCGGYPCVGNTRIPVRLIVALHRATGNYQRIQEWYPHLTPAQIKGALDYYAATPARVDEDFARHAEAQAALQAR